MPTTTRKTTPRKTAGGAAKPAGKPAARKPRATTRAPKAAPKAEEEIVAEVIREEAPVVEVQGAEIKLKAGQYSFGVGRRKTSVANVRLFKGEGKNQVNQTEIDKYFGNKALVDEALKPLQLLGLGNQVYVYVNAKGGGLHSQAQALAHGIALAIAGHESGFRKVLKKNGLLTRDSRMKERKKPGLKRARRGPQWAKR